ncbi:MAG: hypothetical protein R3330_04490, partial [Saprospiraceae bacterium]|nr:hypothetical protein [Saprospiraceae bacterium]
QEASGPLGCTELQILANDTINDLAASECDQRSSKVIAMNSPNAMDSVTVTIFFKSTEVDDWPDAGALNILVVNGPLIDDLSTGFVIIPNSEVVTDQTDDYISYTFRIISGEFSLALTDRSPTPVERIVGNANNDGPESLRQTIADACPADTIRFAPGLVGDTIRLTGPEIIIEKDVLILGPGADLLSVSGEDNSRIFWIKSGQTVTLKDFTCLRGEASGSGDAILNNGTLILHNLNLHQESP